MATPQIPIIGPESLSLLQGTILSENRQTRQSIGCVDATGAVPQEIVITITSPHAAETYTIRFADSASGVAVDVSFTSVDTDATVAATNLRTRMEQDYPLLGSMISLDIEQASGVLTIDALPGVTVVVTEVLDASGDIAITGTAASAAPQYTYGQAVQLQAAAASFPSPMLAQQRRCVEPAVVDGSVLTTTMTYDSTGNASMTVVVTPYPGAPPVSYLLGWAMGANLAASVANLAAEWALTITGADEPTITTDTGVVVATFPAGVTAFPASETTASGTVATVVTEADALPEYGIVLRTNNESPNFTYPGPSAINGPLIGGLVPVLLPSSSGANILVARPSGGVTAGNPVWYETDGATQGDFFAAGSATRVPCPELIWRGNYAADSTLAVLGVK